MGDSKAEDRLALAFMEEDLNLRSNFEIGDMHVDFADPKVKLVVEVDGPHHRFSEIHNSDSRRDYMLRKWGWEVVRISSNEAFFEPRKVAKKIKEKHYRTGLVSRMIRKIINVLRSR